MCKLPKTLLQRDVYYYYLEYPRALETDDTAACLSIRGRGTDTGLKVWEDTDCGEKLNFVCEYLW